MLEVELALGDGLWRNDMTGEMLLQSITVTDLDVGCVEPLEVSFARHDDERCCCGGFDVVSEVRED